MFFDDPASSARANATLARIQYLLHNGANIEAVRRHIEGYMNGACVITDFIPSGFLPRVTTASLGKNRLMIFGGVPNRTVATEFVTGYMYSPFAESPFGFHPTLETAFAQLKAHIDAVFTQDGYYNITLSGYSYGGALAATVAPYIINLNRSASMKVVTFGAPRCFRTPFEGVPSGFYSSWRVMNERDPIPLVPPFYDERSEGYTILSTAGATRMNGWTHVGQGEVWNVNNTASLRWTPDVQALPASYSIVGWASGLMADPVNEHAIATYAARMEQWLPESYAITGPIIPPTQNENVGFEPTHTTPFPVAPNVDQTQNPRIADMIAKLGEPPGDKPYNAYKSNGKWGVWYLGNFLTQCKGRREALKIARDFNQIVRQADESDGADTDAMADSISDFFEWFPRT